MLTYGIPPDSRRPLLYLKRPDAIESAPSLSDHAIAYRWRSLPRVCRHRASKPLGSSERVLPFCRSPWTKQYTPLFPAPTIGMKWACCTSLPWLHLQGHFIFICFALLHVHPCPCMCEYQQNTCTAVNMHSGKMDALTSGSGKI